MDVHVRRAVAAGLRLRGVDVLTAQEDDTGELPDPELLDRATELGRALFTQDDDLLREAKRRQQTAKALRHLCASTWHYCESVHCGFGADCSGQRTSRMA